MLVSVVIPTFHRPDLLERCLSALARQRFDPAAVEVIVADDAASVATQNQVETFARETPVAVRYCAVRGRHGPAAARNQGWRLARGELIAFTDDDCIPDTGWLAAGVEACGQGIQAASGRTIVPLPERPTDYERDAAGLEGAEFVTANCFCRRTALEAVGGFDERFTAAWREDSDLQFRFLEAGMMIVRAPAAIVIHPVRPAPWGISLRQQRKSMFNALLYKNHPDLYRRRIRPATPWDYYAVVACLAGAGASALAGAPLVALAAAALWTVWTAHFCWRRLRGNARTPRHVAEMIVSSALIPPLSVFWRLYGGVKFGVFFL